jgi:hypothetical protein
MTVTEERTTRALTLRGVVSLLDRLPAPESVRFSDTYPEWLYIDLSTTADFDEWATHLSARISRREEEVCDGGSVQSHAVAQWRGWTVALGVCHLTTEEPEWTLTSVEREIEELADEFGRTPYIAPEGGEYEQEPLHVHGVMFREGLGYLADDPECGGCREAATVRWKQAYLRTQQERVGVDADSDAARLVSAVLTPDAPVTDAERNIEVEPGGMR